MKIVTKTLALLLSWSTLATTLSGCVAMSSNMYEPSTHPRKESESSPESKTEANTEAKTEIESHMPSESLDYELSKDGNGFIVTGFGSCEDRHIIIPAEYEGKPVIGVGSYAFSYRSNLTSVVIPNSVISVGNYAFSNCSNLTSVLIPNSVTSIGKSIFSHCSRLSEIQVEEGNPSYHAVGNCLIETASRTLITGCKSSIIPADGSVTSIGKSAFRDCAGLKSIIIPDGVTSIGEYAFEDCTGLSSIQIPNSVVSIGAYAICGCSGLTSIEIPDSVSHIDAEGIFCDCSNLTKVTLPENIGGIGEAAFYNCTRLATIIFKGTKDDWAYIPKYKYWNYNTGYYSVRCTDGTISKKYS